MTRRPAGLCAGVRVLGHIECHWIDLGVGICLILSMCIAPICNAGDRSRMAGGDRSESSLILRFLGDLDSVTIMDPLMRRCSLGGSQVPGCQVWWDAPPSDPEDTTATALYLEAEILDPVAGDYRIQAAARDSADVYVDVTAHIWNSSGHNMCASRAKISVLPPLGTATALVRYRAFVDSCSLGVIPR
jgi:hypothetical protein